MNQEFTRRYGDFVRALPDRVEIPRVTSDYAVLFVAPVIHGSNIS